MTVPKTSRPFRERFLDGFDRSELQKEVQRVKPKRGLSGFRKRAASWGIGATLALGGLGIPLKLGHGATQKTAPQPEPSAADTSTGIANDLSAANQIVNQVATGVQGAVSTVADTAQAAPAAVAQAPQAVANAARTATTGAVETAKEAFFAREVPFGQIIYHEAKKNDLPPELVAAVAHTESKFVPTARSNRGAVGLMQLVPKTARWLGASKLTDPSQNIMAGAKYLKYLTDRFGGDTQKAIAAYNAGEGNVRRFGGVPPFRETRNYVRKVADFQQDLAEQFQGAMADAE
ncbi:MAG TPA: lytic transglycosylase domain-containing protein [Thermoanaerobaculia bacterium]|jgi:soluble lytic murein transglycosylase-like protein